MFWDFFQMKDHNVTITNYVFFFAKDWKLLIQISVYRAD